MKRLLYLAALLAMPASAAPFLYADAYPATGVQPDAASFTINGGSPIACQLETVAAGVRPKCDLASITTPGTYTLVVTVTKAGGIANTSGGATVTQAGSASSAPFAYRLAGGSVPTPVLSVGP